jgi:hypothetical protein
MFPLVACSPTVVGENPTLEMPWMKSSNVKAGPLQATKSHFLYNSLD